jgi:hypothetical protein
VGAWTDTDVEDTDRLGRLGGGGALSYARVYLIRADYGALLAILVGMERSPWLAKLARPRWVERRAAKKP